MVPGERLGDDGFPDDDNGDVLRRMKQGGDRLTESRPIDFSVVFSSEDKARLFCESLRPHSDDIRVSCDNDAAPPIWDVTIVKVMVPTHRDITDFETMLDRIATPLGGRNDGWGCFRIEC